MQLTFRRVEIEDAEMLLVWRKRPDITRHMYTDIDHGVEEQRGWIEACDAAADFRHFVIEYGGAPVGYLSFSGIDPDKGQCTTGFYVAERESGQRYSGVLDVCMVDYAFHVLDVDRIENGVLEGNDRSMAFHENVGFRRMATKTGQVVKNGAAFDVHVYALERAAWEAQERPFPVEESLAAFEVP